MKYQGNHDYLTAQNIFDVIFHEGQRTKRQPDYMVIHPKNKKLVDMENFNWNSESDVWTVRGVTIIWDHVNVDENEIIILHTLENAL